MEYMSDERISTSEKWLCAIFVLVFFMLFFTFISSLILIPAYPKAKIESKLYNERFGKNYTTWDFFWSGDTIKSFLQGGKQETSNININGAIPVKIQE